MKHSIIIASAVLAALLSQSCAKSPELGTNDANKKYLDSWILINHPDAQRDAQGIFILDDEPGQGRAIGSAEDYPFAYVSYTKTDLEGNILETTEEKVAQQIGTYSEGNYYGPKVVVRLMGSMTAGMERLLDGMHVGGTRTAMVPGWFDTSTKRFAKEEDYMEYVTGSDYIYKLTLHDSYKNMGDIQIDSIENYLRKNFKAQPDSVMFGYYYIQLTPPTDTTTISKSTTVYVNYTGRLLNDQVFDTTDDKTAKDAGIYSRSKTYEPYGVELAEDYTEMDTVKGFSYCVSNMKAGEKGICIFYSDLGYSSSAQASIPAFSPLRFDIEMIGTEKK